MILSISTKDQKSVTVQLKNSAEVVDELTEFNEFGSQILLPLITKLLKNNHLEFKDLTAIEVDPGPGSFTGLRVGAAVGQALGLALNIPVNNQTDGVLSLIYQ